YEKAIAASNEDLRLNPGSAAAYTNLVGLYAAVHRLDAAKETYRQAAEHKIDNPILHGNRYGVAFLENDAGQMEQQIAATSGRAGEDVLVSFASDSEAFYGRLEKARNLSQRAIESAHSSGAAETAAAWRMNSALREAEFGNSPRSREQVTAALAEASTRDLEILAALALARAGDIGHAKSIADDLSKRFPLNTAINRYWLPTIYAAIELQRHNPAKAVDLLETTSSYELGTPLPQFEVGGSLYPIYIRGEAYLSQGRGKEAGAEFQKIFDHNGILINSPLASLARLQLSRALALEGDTAKAKDAFQEFLTTWSNADPNLPVLASAKAEYKKLK